MTVEEKIFVLPITVFLNKIRTFFIFKRITKELFEWLFLRHFSCVSYIYLHVHQKQLSCHTKIGGIGGGGANNAIAIILSYDFQQSLYRSNNLRYMIVLIL